MGMRWIAMILSAAVLAGCATPAEQAARMEREMDRLMVVNGPACEKLGFSRDSDAWRSCVLRLAERESYERYSRAPVSTTCFGHPGFLNCTSF